MPWSLHTKDGGTTSSPKYWYPTTSLQCHNPEGQD